MPTEQRQHFLDNLQEDTKRLEKLVTRLLEQARADAQQTSSEICNILQVLSQLQPTYKAKNLMLVLDKSLDETVIISADALIRVFSNLFDNSLQHNANEVLIKLSHIGSQLQLSIHDNGTGISSANQSRIFTPFFTTRRDTGGTGLGLGIIASTLSTWNGTIALQNSEQGAHFIITL
jgi:signal transduction histidine kinase